MGTIIEYTEETMPSEDLHHLNTTVGDILLSASPDETACNLYNLFARVIFGGSVIIFGLIGNVLTILVMAPDRRKSPTVLLLFYLAIVDSMVLIEYGVMALPVAILRFAGWNLQALQLQMYCLAYLIPIGQTTNLVSVLVTVIVTWQRYISVCMPHKAKAYGSIRHVNIQVIFSIFFSIIFNSPQLFQVTVANDYPTKGKTAIITNSFARTLSYQVFYSIVLFYLVSYILPMIALTFMTFGLIRSLAKVSIRRQSITGQIHRAREELTISLVVVVIIFIICQSIGPARRILMWVYDPYRSAIQCGGKLFYFAPWEILSLLINSAVNFVIYVLCAKGFRKKLNKLIIMKTKVEIDDLQGTGNTYQLDSIVHPEG